MLARKEVRDRENKVDIVPDMIGQFKRAAAMNKQSRSAW